MKFSGLQKAVKKDSKIEWASQPSSKTSLLFKKGFTFPSFGFSKTERINFFKDLSVMISAGISIVESLEMISDQMRNRRVRKNMLKMAGDTKNGQNLHAAMRKYPKLFPGAIPEIVRMGEVSGKLTETLDRISVDLEKRYTLNKKVVGALAYPAIVIVVMIIVAGAFMFYILPEIAKLFIEMGVPVPLPTKILLSLGTFITGNYLFLTGLAALFGVILYALLKKDKTRYLIHHFILRIPILGDFIKDYSLVVFSRSLNSLMSSGVSIITAVKIARGTINNDAYKKALDEIYPSLIQGISLSKTLAPYPFIFPPQVQKIISVGERSGTMNESMKRVTDYYERSVEHKIRMMTALIEPVLMLIVGIVVGGLALSLFLPLYGIVNAF